MGTLHGSGKSVPQRHDLAAGEHRSLHGAPGAVIRVLSGRVWITQQGDSRDYVVPGLACFAVARHGMLVVSALEAGASIVVDRMGAESAAEWGRNAVRLEPGFVEGIERAARREAALAFSRAVCGLWRGVCRWWRQRFAPARSGGIGRGYHC